MIKIKPIHYIRAKKLTAQSQLNELVYTTFSKNRLGMRPRVSIPAELFENRFNFTDLPKNLIIKVKGQVEKGLFLEGSSSTMVNFDVVNNFLNAMSGIKVKVKTAKQAVFGYNTSSFDIKNALGKVVLEHESKGEFGTLHKGIELRDKASAYANKTLGKIEANNNSNAYIRDLNADAKAFDNAGIVYLTKKDGIKTITRDEGKIEPLLTDSNAVLKEYELISH